MKELEETLANVQSKLASMEKTKNRIASELEDVNLDLEKVHIKFEWLSGVVTNSVMLSPLLLLFVGAQCSSCTREEAEED